MKINYEATIDEVVDLQLRILERSKTVRKWKRQGLIGAPFAFALTYLMIAYLFVSFTIVEKLVFSSLAGISFIAFYLGTHKARTRGRVRRLLVEQLGSDGPFPTEYELRDDGLVVQTKGTEIKFDWSNFTEVNETDLELELIAGTGGIAALPKRVFQSEEQLNEWLNCIREKTGIA